MLMLPNISRRNDAKYGILIILYHAENMSALIWFRVDAGDLKDVDFSSVNTVQATRQDENNIVIEDEEWWDD